MGRKFLGIWFVLIFLSSLNGMGQISSPKHLKSLFANPKAEKPGFSKPLKNAQNEFDVVVSAGFLSYKTFISSQDKPSCIFTPSCSEYSVEAFKVKGPIGGWLHTFDRLSRCHSFVDHSHYQFDIKKNRFYDPIH